MRTQKPWNSSYSVYMSAGRNAFVAGISLFNNPYRTPESRHYWEAGFKQAKTSYDEYWLIKKKGPEQFEERAKEAGTTAERYFHRILASRQPYHPTDPKRTPAAREERSNRPAQQQQQPKPQSRPQGKQHTSQGKPQAAPQVKKEPSQPHRKSYKFRNTIGQSLNRSERKAVWATANKSPASPARSRP